MREAWRVLTAIAVLTATQGASAVAAESPKITPEAIRAAQIGLLQDFNNLPPTENLTRQIDASDGSPVLRRPGLSDATFVTQFVGGTKVPKDSFKQLAKIRFIDADGAKAFCSGIILSERKTSVVLTAAHCSCGRLDSYRIFAGDNAEAHKIQTFFLASRPERYAGYSCQLLRGTQVGRDLAILRFIEDKFARDNDFPPSIDMFPLVPIATMHEVYRDSQTKRLVGAGFGQTEREDEPKDAVAAIIPIRSFFCGGDQIAASECANFREFVLADPRAGTGGNAPDSCGGDSGAPIFWVPPAVSAESKKLELFLVGITSRALDGVRHSPGTTCGGGGIYTAVGHPDVVKWLQSQGIYARTKIDVREKKSQ